MLDRATTSVVSATCESDSVAASGCNQDNRHLSVNASVNTFRTSRSAGRQACPMRACDGPLVTYWSRSADVARSELESPFWLLSRLHCIAREWVFKPKPNRRTKDRV